MQSEPDSVTVDEIPLGLERVEPHIPLPIAFAGAIEIALSPLTIRRSERSEKLIRFGRPICAEGELISPYFNLLSCLDQTVIL
jgi:hypothetical protein